MALSECTNLVDLHDQELAKHGDTSFPIACYHDILHQNPVPWHWHEEWEYAIVTRDSAEFQMENKSVLLNTGDGIFVNSKALHGVRCKKNEHGELHSAVFHPRLIGGNTDSIFWQNIVQPLHQNESLRYLVLHSDIPWQEEVLRIFERVWRSVESEIDDYENLVRYELSRAFHILIQNSDFSTLQLSQQELVNADRIRTMLEYVEEHYNEEFTIDDIAETITASPSVVLRVFHQMLDTSPMQYVKQLRIRKAADQLLHTNKTAKEIALENGFNDVSYFTKSFRETYQVTPSQYRKGAGTQTAD